MLIDKLASYEPSSEIMPSVKHRKHKDLNNGAENSQ